MFRYNKADHYDDFIKKANLYPSMFRYNTPLFLRPDRKLIFISLYVQI